MGAEAQRMWLQWICESALDVWCTRRLIYHSSSAVRLYLTVQGRGKGVGEHCTVLMYYIFPIKGGFCLQPTTSCWWLSTWQFSVFPRASGVRIVLQLWFYWERGCAGGCVVCLSCLRNSWKSKSLLSIYFFLICVDLCFCTKSLPLSSCPRDLVSETFCPQLSCFLALSVDICFWMILCLFACEFFGIFLIL